MRKYFMLCGLLGLSLVLTGCGSSGPKQIAEVSNPDKQVTLISPIQYGESAEVRQAIRDECQLPEKLEHFIKVFSAEQNIAVTTDERASGQILTVEIVRAYGPGGGAYSGAKSVTIEAELQEGGEVIGTLTARRISGGGAFSGFKGTCDILGRDVKTLGSDVANFLSDPSMNARMGNL